MSGVSGLKIFRLNAPERWVITPIGATILVAVGMSWTRSDQTPDRIVGALVVAGAVAGACWLMLRVRVVLSPERLEITNLRSHAIPYSEIIDLHIAYEGLRVRTRTRSYVALAVQKSNLSKITGRKTRADTIADEIRMRAAAASAGKNPAAPG